MDEWMNLIVEQTRLYQDQDRYHDDIMMMHVYQTSCVLLQWKGLPYGECTFETPEAISQAGGQDQLDQYEVEHLPSGKTHDLLPSECCIQLCLIQFQHSM